MFWGWGFCPTPIQLERIMAKGRVGGTKAKIRGQVGDTIYQIRNNGDGTYTQVVLEKGVRTESETSELLQAHRMCTAIVQALMRDIKAVGQIAVQGAKTMTESLNTISSANLKAVANDCKDHWYDAGRFHFPLTTNKGTLLEELGGFFQISSGTLQHNIFDEMIFDDEPYRKWNGGFGIHDYFYALRFIMSTPAITLGQFLSEHHMTRNDLVVMVLFHEWSYEVDGEDELEWETRHDWFIAQINPAVSDSDILTPAVLRQLFVWKSSADVSVAPSNNGNEVAIGFKLDWYDNDDTAMFWGSFSKSKASGKWLISPCTMSEIEDAGSEYLSGSRPTNVFYSWMRAPRNPNWPSPYNQQ